MPEAFISITTSPGPGVGSGKLRTSTFRFPKNTAPRISGNPQKSLLADLENLVGIALPPVELGEDLDLVESRIARALDRGADARQVDDAGAHHAAVGDEVARRHQPVADVISENAFLAGAPDLALELRVPPNVVDVHRNAYPVSQHIT